MMSFEKVFGVGGGGGGGGGGRGGGGGGEGPGRDVAGGGGGGRRKLHRLNYNNSNRSFEQEARGGTYPTLQGEIGYWVLFFQFLVSAAVLFFAVFVVLLAGCSDVAPL